MTPKRESSAAAEVSRKRYEERINRVLDHIEDHLAEDLSLARLAQVACFSPFHFHRIFRELTGETLNRFIRRRRVERAARKMRARPEAAATGIALEVGFSELAELSRAFRAHFGIRIRDWDRRAPLEVSAVEKSKIDQAAHGMPRYALEDLRAEAQRRGLQVYLRSVPKLRYVYRRVEDSYSSMNRIREAYEDVERWLEPRAEGLPHAWIGMSMDDPEVVPIEKCRYDIGMAFAGPHEDLTWFDDLSALRGQSSSPPCDVTPKWLQGPLPRDLRDRGLSVRDLEAHTSAHLACRGDLTVVDVAWQYLFRVWLPESAHEPRSMPGMEVFVRLPSEIGWDTWDVLGCVPVRAF